MSARKSAIKVGSVTLSVTKHAKGWRVPYKDSTGEWKYITRKDLTEAKEEARKKAREIHNGMIDVADLSADTKKLLRQILDLCPTADDLREFAAWKQRQEAPTTLLSEAIKSFLLTKQDVAGKSIRNIESLNNNLARMLKSVGDIAVEAVKVEQLEEWLRADAKSPRGRKNLRASAVTLFRWCRDREILPDKRTEAEKVATSRIVGTVPETYTPEEISKMLAAVKPAYLPWLACSAFAGIRLEELAPPTRSTKRPLQWEDFAWDRDVIIIHPDTDKNGRRRVIPIQPNLKAWLKPLAKTTGNVHDATRPSYKAFRLDGKRVSQTTLLAQAIGGEWRNNALRHSFISYRAAMVGLAKTAMEAGNSEAEAKASYNDAKGEDEALKWFTISPKT